MISCVAAVLALSWVWSVLELDSAHAGPSDTDARPCNEVLEGQVKPDSIESAVAGAWAETLNFALAESRLSAEAIAQRLLELDSAPALFPTVFAMTNSIPMAAELSDAMESLAALALNFLEQGSASEAALETALRRQVAGFLFRLGVEGRVLGEADELRAEARMAATVVPAYGRLIAPPTPFSDGSFVSADAGGHVVRFNDRGKLLYDVGLGAPFSRGAVELANGRMLVSAASGHSWVLDVDGRLESRFAVPPGYGATVPFKLRDGGVLYAGGQGSLRFFNEDGSERESHELSVWIAGAPIQQEDGTILILSAATATLYRFAPDARLIDSIPLLDGLTLQGSLTLLPGGGGLVIDHRGMIHFLDGSWKPKKRWWLFSSVTFKPEGGAFGEITPYSDGLFGVQGWKEGFVVFDEHGRKRWSLSDFSIGGLRPLEVSPGVFFLKSDSRGWILGGPGRRGLHVCPVHPRSRIGAPPSLLADGTIAVGHGDGLLQILRPDGSEAFSHRFAGPIAAEVRLISGGRYLVPVEGLGNVIFDPLLAAEEDGDAR